MRVLKCTCCGGVVKFDPLTNLYMCWHCGTPFMVEEGEGRLNPGPYYEERTKGGQIVARLSVAEIKAMYRLGLVHKAEALHQLTEAGYTGWQASVLLASEDFKLGVTNSMKGGDT